MKSSPSEFVVVVVFMIEFVVLEAKLVVLEAKVVRGLAIVVIIPEVMGLICSQKVP